MDHAEAHERIADLALEAGRLAELASDPSTEARMLIAHVEACTACRTDLEAWRRTQDALRASIEPGSPLGAVPAEPAMGGRPDEPPASLRAAVVRIAAPTGSFTGPAAAGTATGSADAASPPSEPITGAAGLHSATRRGAADRSRAWLRAGAAVAAVLLIVGLTGVAVDQARRSERADQQATALADLASRLERVMRADHTSVPLVGLDGQPAGTAAWSTDTIVVVSTALAPPGQGLEYRCWVERDGQRTPVGVMRFDGGLAAWAGPIGRYDDLALDGGGRLGVSLETVGKPGGSAPVLIGQLPD